MEVYTDLVTDIYTDYYGYNRLENYLHFCKFIKNGTISKEGPVISQPTNIKLTLLRHQQRSVFQMLEHEEFLKKNYITNTNINMGILADKVGSGKSLSILSLISQKPFIGPSIMYENRNDYNKQNRPDIMKIMLNNEDNCIKTNLILVPHGTFHQWQFYIKEFTDLKCLFIDKRATFYSIKNKDELEAYTVVLCKSTMINDLLEHLKNITGIETLSNSTFRHLTCYIGEYTKQHLYFERVIIDEGDTIKLPNCPVLIGKMNWFLSSSIFELMFNNTHVKSLIRRFKHNSWYSGTYPTISSLIDKFRLTSLKGINNFGFIKSVFEIVNDKSVYWLQRCIFKNNDQFVLDSYTLPEPNKISYDCLTPPELLLLNQQIGKNIDLGCAIQALCAGDVETAKTTLGCDAGSASSIQDLLTNKLKSQLEQAESSLANRQTVLEVNLDMIDTLTTKNQIPDKLKDKYSSVDKAITELTKKQETYYQQITEWEFKINNIKLQISNIIERIDIKDKNCPICCNGLTIPIIVPCCKNVFCSSCLLQCISMPNMKDQCPMCRGLVKKDKLFMVDTSTNANEDEDAIEVVNDDDPTLPTKLEVFEDIIKTKLHEKTLVFSEYDATFKPMENICKKYGIKFAYLKGSSMVIKKKMKMYDSGEIPVLFLNAKYFGSGLNLHHTNNIIMYHRMSTDIEMQIIGRALRIGRKMDNILNIHYLLYDVEEANIH